MSANRPDRATSGRRSAVRRLSDESHLHSEHTRPRSRHFILFYIVNTGTKRRFMSGCPWWFSTAFIGFAISFSILVIVLPHRSFPVGPLLTSIVVIVGFLAFRLSSPQIYLGDNCLYIDRMWRKATIPLDQVAGIEETKLSWPFRSQSIIIRFRIDTPFGRSLYLGSFGNVPSMTFPWVVKDLKCALRDLPSKQSSQWS